MALMLCVMRHLLPAALTLLLAAAPAFAQGAATAVATGHAPVYVVPDTTRTPLRTAAQGTVFTVVAEEGEWTRVQFKDPQWGVRVGYVETRLLRFNRPELAPMDLSVSPAAPGQAPPSPAPAAARETAPPRPWEVPEPANSFERAFIDVNFGVAWAAEKAFTLEVSGPLFRETRTYRMSYQSPTGASFDFGGGFMFTPEVGIGISIVGTAHQNPVDLFISVPHPTAFNANATDTETTDGQFQRLEGSVNLQLVGAAEISERVRIRVLGGPTYFRIQQDLVSDIRYAQVFGVFNRVNEVDIQEYEVAEKVEGTGWGFHVAGDVSIFFNRVVGIGGFARYSRGAVEIDDPITGDPIELDAGGFQVGGGLRLKF